MALLQPRNVRIRDPKSNKQDNGQIVNPPRFPEMAFPQRNAWGKNRMKVEKPAGGKKVI